MADTCAEIPDREWFKPSEVCEIASVQPYVLRSWEIEFPGLGIQRSAGGPRVYRRSDVERVLKIRHLVFVEGLTLAGVRRTIEGEAPAVEGHESGIVDADTRARLVTIRHELRSLHEWLSAARPTTTGEAPAASAGPAQQTLPNLDGQGAATESWPPRGQARRRSRKKS